MSIRLPMVLIARPTTFTQHPPEYDGTEII
jgi:hypothetical protein